MWTWNLSENQKKSIRAHQIDWDKVTFQEKGRQGNSER